MDWIQRQIQLRPRPRGFHLVGQEILEQLPEVAHCAVGTLQLFIQHTSASLSINENADPSVRVDFEYIFNRLVPENDPNYRHQDEGPDDMPAHVKASLLGCCVNLPICQGQLATGTWQGIYLGEHRDHAGSRRIMATLCGQF